MSEIANLGQILAQTKMIERLQEGARRQGEIEQQQTTERLVDKVDIQGRQVDEPPEAREAKVDPEGKSPGGQEGEERPKEEDEKREAETAPQSPASAQRQDRLDDGEGKGRSIDVQA